MTTEQTGALDSLIGTWQLLAFGVVDAQEAADSERPATITFDNEGHISGTTGCNRLRGSYTTGEGRITFSPLATTRMACFGDLLQRQEIAVLAVLHNTVEYTFSAHQLHLVANDASQRLIFEVAT